MKIRIGDQIIDSDKQPIALIFDTDKQRKDTAGLLTRMDERTGPRIVALLPAAQHKSIEVATGYVKQTLIMLGHVE
ncbi:hypothetical protein [Chitinophaga sp.]|uniref:hypothetical protein n=1 Tax=Chitinophaga sp. TaxID=1869181 RepID=UPI002C324E55|nr:hypothetical protein [Chitinophaga sp.]HWV64359.1 hypothetical protein [Chitinophaga sp.]